MENKEQKEAVQQPVSGQQQPAMNPFNDDAPAEQPTPEEEADLEQQRKEALTERD